MSDRWTELRSLFEELVALDEADRAARLREIGQRDEQRRNRLERMLLADAAADTRIHEYAEAAARSILAEPGARSEGDPLGLLGSMVGRYRINQLLGTGGMGVVYRATDERLGRVAALKFLPPVWSADRRAKERFLNEARAASSLDHPNVCTVYVGVSMGADSRLPWAAVDERFSAVILLGGGIDERMQPTVPEASSINFAPYIRAPKLLLNGRNDEESHWETRALPLWELLSEPKELMLIEGAGHLVPVEERIPAMAGWLDRTFRPVRY